MLAYPVTEVYMLTQSHRKLCIRLKLLNKRTCGESSGKITALSQNEEETREATLNALLSARLAVDSVGITSVSRQSDIQNIIHKGPVCKQQAEQRHQSPH